MCTMSDLQWENAKNGKMIVVKWHLENEVSSLVWRIDGARAMKWCISNSAITDFLSDGVFGKDIGRWMSECC